ncbi:MAG: response regulator [Magnetococcales bacterium]|nr:response regulator [Magnetococcales bacterium]
MNTNHRILVIDDDAQLLDTYREILHPPVRQHSQLEDFLGLSQEQKTILPDFEITTAAQGAEGVELVEHALEADKPFAVAFVDVRMPPGIDGVETVRRIREVDDNIYIIMVTAYSDRSVDEMQLAARHDVVLARKPLGHEEIIQLARNACNSWNGDQILKQQKDALHRQVREMSVTRWYMEKMLSATKEGFLICSMDGTIRSANNAACTLLGHDIETLKQTNFATLFIETDTLPLLQEIVKSGISQTVKRQPITNGTTPTNSALSITPTPMRDPEQHTEQVIMITLTDRMM